MNISHIINRRSTTIALLVSLLLHITMALYFALEKGILSVPFLSEKESLTELLQKKDPIKKEAEWVATKGRNSTFGADVLFRDEPDEEIIPDLSLPQLTES